MKVFVFVLAAAVLIQAASCNRWSDSDSDSCSNSWSDSDSSSDSDSCSDSWSDSDSCSSDSSSDSDSCSSDSSSDSDSCSDSSDSDSCSDSDSWSDSDSSDDSDDCRVVKRTRVIKTSPCETNQKIYLHRQRPIYVRPPASQIRINHPPVLVKQPPVILHHQSRNPTIIKPILIKEREVCAKPVQFRINNPDCKVHVSKCKPPKVHVSGCHC